MSCRHSSAGGPKAPPRHSLPVAPWNRAACRCPKIGRRGNLSRQSAGRALGQAAGRDRGGENIQTKTSSYFPVLRSGIPGAAVREMGRRWPAVKMAKKCAGRVEPTELVRVGRVLRLGISTSRPFLGGPLQGEIGEIGRHLRKFHFCAECVCDVDWPRGIPVVVPGPGTAATPQPNTHQSPAGIGHNAAETQSLLPLLRFGAKPCSRAVKQSAI